MFIFYFKPSASFMFMSMIDSLTHKQERNCCIADDHFYFKNLHLDSHFAIKLLPVFATRMYCLEYILNIFLVGGYDRLLQQFSFKYGKILIVLVHRASALHAAGTRFKYGQAGATNHLYYWYRLIPLAGSSALKVLKTAMKHYYKKGKKHGGN